jgi:glycosyltransferase involved in cell wall biosynthesis
LVFPSNWKKVLADFNHFTFTEQFVLPYLIYRELPDVVHFPFFNVPIFYFGKFIVTIHDLTMHKFKGGEATTRGFIRNFIWRIGYKIAYYKAVYGSAKIITPSKTVKNELARYYQVIGGKIVAIYEGVDENIKLTTGVDPKKRFGISHPYFIYSGSAYPHKNITCAIEAISRLNLELHSKVMFVMTSSRSIFFQRIANWVKANNCEKYVKQVGFVTDKELALLYKHAIGFIYPTLSEGFGLPVLEAMSVGTLGLASNIEVLGEIYGDKVLYFDPLDAGSIKETMLQALRLTSSEREEMISSGRKFVKRYSWIKMAKATLMVYTDTKRV